MKTFDEITFERTESGCVYMTARSESVGYWHFVFAQAEWQLILDRWRGRGNRDSSLMFVDGYHKCDASWRGCLTFTDTDRLPTRFGLYPEATVRVWVAECPVELLEHVEAMLPQYDEGKHNRRPEVTLSRAEVESFLARYGQGKGQCRIEYSDHSKDDGPALLASRLETDIARDESVNGRDARLREIVEQWRRIVLNTTWAHDDEGVLRICRDMDGYYVEAVTPDGRRTMNGGWVNHGTTDAPSWSSHT